MDKKEKKTPRLFWQKLIEVYFEFCREKFGETPTFDGSSPRDLGLLVDAIQKKAGEKKLVWTEELAVRSLRVYLDFAFKDSWLQKNFLLFNLNRQKDKIFFTIKNSMNEKSNSNQEQRKFSGSYKTAGQEVFADRLKQRIEKLQ